VGKITDVREAGSTHRAGRARQAARGNRKQAAPGEGRHPRWIRWLGPAAFAAAALMVAACGSSSSGSGSSASTSPSAGAGAASFGSTLNTTTISGVTVLTNAKGFTLYSFAPDTTTVSKCDGTCAQIWPPVKGPVTAGSGVAGKLGTITRTGGATQATYNGHPLYTYVGDTQPGQASGNNLNLNGGLWHEVTISGGGQH
jgi:predicted lipoprotein with Yx(FWY)xxD motif